MSDRFAQDPVHQLGHESGPGERLRRLRRRRRLHREELLAVLFLVLALAVTVVVLATQWLSSGSSANAAMSVYTVPIGGTA